MFSIPLVAETPLSKEEEPNNRILVYKPDVVRSFNKLNFKGRAIRSATFIVGYIAPFDNKYSVWHRT